MTASVCTSLSILRVLVIFIIYQSLHFFSNKYKALPTKFYKCLMYYKKDNVISVIFDVYFDLQCVNVASSRVCSSDKMIPLLYFSVSLNFGVCYITGQWSEFTTKNATLCFHLLFWHFFVVFHHKICVFIILI